MIDRCRHCDQEIYEAENGWRHVVGGKPHCYKNIRFDAEPKSEARARTTDPQTSHDAALSVGDLRPKQLAVYRLLRSIGPSTDEQIAKAYDGRHKFGMTDSYPQQSLSGLRTRRSELVKGGLVVDTGEKRTMTTGRKAIVWDAVQPEGEELPFTKEVSE